MRAALLLALASCAVDPTGAPELGTTEQHASVCADGPTTYGIDVSRFQGEIDWPQVAASGVQYAYIQISRSLTDIDARFPYNWSHAKAAGIARGAYQRFHPGEDVDGQADLFLSKLGPIEPGDLPPMLDVEDADGLSGPQIAAAVRHWIERVEPVVGMRPIIYTGFYFWRDQVGGADLSAYPLWIANYGTDCPLVPAAWSSWTFHQYSSSARIPGITANTVDVDRFNGTLDELRALAEPPPPCQTIAAAPGGDVIDEAGSCFVAGGDPQFIRHENAGYGSSLAWTHTTDAAAPSNFGRWNLHFAEAGRYRVEVFTPAPFAQSRAARYRITHAGVTDEVVIDQQAVDGWQVLGELDFEAGGDQAVRVDDNTGEPNPTNTQLVFDAVRVTRVDASPTTPTGDDPADEEDGDDLAGAGCAAGGGGGGWLIALGLAIAASRRARGLPSAGARASRRRHPGRERA